MTSALRAADAAASKKGERVVVLDMRDVTLIADYFVIVSAMNVIQVESIAEAVQEALQSQGLTRLNHSAKTSGHWVLLDYGSVVVHIFTEAERNYYDLERLWGDARIVERQPLNKMPAH